MLQRGAAALNFWPIVLLLAVLPHIAGDTEREVLPRFQLSTCQSFPILQFTASKSVESTWPAFRFCLSCALLAWNGHWFSPDAVDPDCLTPSALRIEIVSSGPSLVHMVAM